MRRILFLSIIGVGGAAILLALGVWQIQRLSWKQAIIADIEARIVAAPVALPDAPDPQADNYLPVTVEGVPGPDHLRVLVSQKDIGAGYRIITPLAVDDGPILLDRGFIAVDATLADPPREPVARRFTGNLQWPQETDGFTPAPDTQNNIWFARDVAMMAEALGTRPILLVQRDVAEGDPGTTPLPVDTSRIPNDHLQYAITWFSLAAIWFAMTLTFTLRRRSPRTES